MIAEKDLAILEETDAVKTFQSRFDSTVYGLDIKRKIPKDYSDPIVNGIKTTGNYHNIFKSKELDANFLLKV